MFPTRMIMNVKNCSTAPIFIELEWCEKFLTGYIRVIEKTGDIKKAMKMVKYHFCEMQEKTLPLSESAYVSYDGRNRDYRMHIRGQRKKMTEIEKKNYQETISLIDKLEQY